MSCGSAQQADQKNELITNHFKMTPLIWRLLRAWKRALQMEWRFVNEVYLDLRCLVILAVLHMFSDGDIALSY